ncbi:MAG TPA: nucleotide exchange factor GrpE [Stellaceae bacterium]|nr:nucleotide exchange factor GrpE [Stellaceae bacterium]
MTEDENGAAGAESQTPPEADRIGALEAELGETKDKLLRALAETENTRRRAQREREDTQRYAVANFAKDVVTVADNLRRAIDAAGGDAARDDLAQTLLAGVAATERELLAVLERHGVKKIDPQPGDRFDPNLHEAMFELENTARPAGSIVQVLQPGYRIHDRLLRAAMVGVAKAPGPAARVDEVV